MKKLLFSVNQQSIKRIDTLPVISDALNYFYIKVDFDVEWDGLIKHAVFKSLATGDTFDVILVNDECEIPPQITNIAGKFSVSVYGGDLYTTESIYIEVLQSGYEVGEPPAPTEPTQNYVKTFSDESGVQLIKIVDEEVSFYDGTNWVVLYKAAELQRIANEGIRISQEEARELAEGLRVGAEINRESNEIARAVWEIHDNTKQYKKGNKVSYQGSSYIASEEPPIGTLPTDILYYSMIASKGEQGEQGDPPLHEWNDTSLRFENPDGTFGNYVDLKGDKGEQGIQGVKGDIGEVSLAQLNAVDSKVTSLKEDYASQEKGKGASLIGISSGTFKTATVAGALEEATHIPFGMTNFAIYLNSRYEFEEVKAGWEIQGDFTSVKHSSVRALGVGNQQFIVSNKQNDSIFVGNQAYNFIIRLKKNNVIIFNFTQASSIMDSDGSPNRIVATEVDYMKNQIRMSDNLGRLFTWNIPELAQLKDTKFDKVNLGISSYGYFTKYCFIINGCLPYSLINTQVLNEAKDMPANVCFGNKSGNLMTAPPKRGWKNRPFVNGKITYNQSEITDGNVENNYLLFSSETFDMNRAVSNLTLMFIRFPLTVVNGTLTLRKTTTVSLKHMYIEDRVTKERTVMDMDNIIIPSGEWDLCILLTSGIYGYPQRFVMNIGFGEMSVGSSFIMHEDIIVKYVNVLASAIPFMANYERGYCPFSKQFAVGNWILNNNTTASS